MTPEDNTTKKCWVLTDGKAGTENQCIGLAEAIGMPFEIKRIKTKWPWTWLPVDKWPFPFVGLDKHGELLFPPWPDLLISSGRHSVPYALAIKKIRAEKTITVQIQNPRVKHSAFDLIITPQHDELGGPNILNTIGALNRITPDRLAEASREFEPLLKDLPRPLVCVLIGGSNKFYTLTPKIMADLCARLKALHDQTGCGFAVTASRRTGEENLNALRTCLSDLPAFLWDGPGSNTGANPYFGMLALSDALIVTCDSVSMASEASATGKPVYIVKLDSKPNKFDRFHQVLEQAGHTRPFEGQLDFDWPAPALSETEAAATRVNALLRAVKP